MRSDDGKRVSEEAERLYAHFLAMREGGEPVELAGLTSDPALQAELELLDADLNSVAGVLERAGINKSLLGKTNYPTMDIEGPGHPVEVDEVEHSASRMIARLTERPHPYKRYKITGEVGRGGMGAILSARDEDLRRDIVLKVARPGRNPDRFLEEAQVTGQLDHPGIVPVHELSTDDAGRLYFTMKLVKGRDLRRIFDYVWDGREGWTLNRALRAILKVCEAVAYAHDKRVIHRDLKPHNIMVGRFGEVYVMDWGLARVLGPRDEDEDAPEPFFYTTHVRSDRAELFAEEPDSPFATMVGAAVGTPAYMSPEQAQGRRDELGPTTDVYAIGAILYQLLTQRMPYVDPLERVTSVLILERVRTAPPEPVRSLNPDVDPALAAICDKAMSRDPHDRHPNVLALAEDLSGWLDGQSAGSVNERDAGARLRQRAWLVAAGLGAITLLAGLVTSSTLYVEASEGLEEMRSTHTELADWILANTDDVVENRAIRAAAEKVVAERDGTDDGSAGSDAGAASGE